MLFASHIRLTLKWVASAAARFYEAIPVVVQPRVVVRVPKASRARRQRTPSPCERF